MRRFFVSNVYIVWFQKDGNRARFASFRGNVTVFLSTSKKVKKYLQEGMVGLCGVCGRGWLALLLAAI